MSIRDLFLNLLIGIGFVGFVVAVSALETIPFWVAVIVAALLWLVYIVLVIRDHARDIKYPILRYRPAPVATRPEPQPIFDQDQKEEN